MMYTVLQNDLSLGWYKTIASLLTILSSLYFARKSSPKLRLPLYIAGGVLVSLSSVVLSIHQDFVALVLYILLSSVGLNLVGTMLDSWSYASIELDPEYKERRLDYIVIREVPLGIGRVVGVSLFLLLQQFFQSYTLAITFALFGSVYLLLIPGLARIWRKPSTTISCDDGMSMD